MRATVSFQGPAFAAAALALLLLPGVGAADPRLPECPKADQCVIELRDGAETRAGTILPPGYYMTYETYEKIDKEVVRLQNAETSLLRQKESLIESLEKAKPPWMWIGVALLVGAAGGLAYGLRR